MSWDAGEVRRRARKMAQSNNIVVESLARLIEQILIEANQYHVERIAKLEAVLVELWWDLQIEMPPRFHERIKTLIAPGGDMPKPKQ